MELQKFIEAVSLYRPSLKWEIEKTDTPQALQLKFTKFLEEVGDMSPVEHSFLQWVLWRNHWKPLEEPVNIIGRRLFLKWLNYRNEPSALEESDELVRFQCGTSLFRAQKFIECGNGHVWVENPIGTDEYAVPERVLGLQVSIPHGPRGEIDRLEYYAETQAERWGDKPVVLTGLISKRYLFCERNQGEFAISIRDYNKIISPEILSTNEYEKKYL